MDAEEIEEEEDDEEEEEEVDGDINEFLEAISRFLYTNGSDNGNEWAEGA